MSGLTALLDEGLPFPLPLKLRRCSRSKWKRTLHKIWSFPFKKQSANPTKWSNTLKQFVGNSYGLRNKAYFNQNSDCYGWTWLFQTVVSKITLLMREKLLRNQEDKTVAKICSVKKEFFKILQNSQENSWAKVSFLMKFQPPGYNERSM